ncbi:MAG TPA: glycerol-3-phosphate dehydrogenase/oxidase [Gallionellaceae bacterium]
MRRDFSQLHNQRFDLLVCGGGIYGAWTAYDAALRGLKVALVEQGDWAGGTSSASSKLIHGGLRYLETYDFKLVNKALAERGMLLAAAPHRVWPLRFGVPLYAHGRIGSWRMKAGLTLYDLMAGKLGAGMRHRHFSAQEFSRRFPLLRAQALRDGYTYADAQTDDARLVLELVAGAQAAGAVCVNYCKVADLIETSGRAAGARLEDRLDEARCEIAAQQIVYTNGQWSSTEREARSWSRLAKGVHLLLPGSQLDEALLLTAPADGRVFFIIPWYGRTLLGTTDTDYRGDLDRIAVEDADIAYLLAAANAFLNTAWRREDVIGSYAGLRVLKQDGDSGANPSSLSRDWELKTTANGTHYSIGGKLTSAREDAAVIVDTVCAQLGRSIPCATSARPFPWAPAEDFTPWHARTLAQAAALGIDAESAHWLQRRHGTRTAGVLQLIWGDASLAQRILPELPFIYADLLFCAQGEMVVRLDDLLRRRLPLLILARLDATQLHSLANRVAAVLGWDEARQAREVELCAQRWLTP